MQLRNSKAAYGWVAIVLHWLATIAVIVMFAYGLQAEWAGDAGDRAARRAFMGTHIATGVFVAILFLALVAWSLLQPKPAPLQGSRFLDLVSRLTYYALLAGLFLLAASGPLAAFAGDPSIRVFNWFEIPSPFPTPSETAEEIGETLHLVGRYLLWIFVPLHVLGALKHLVINRDRTVQRMLWVNKDADGTPTARGPAHVTEPLQAPGPSSTAVSKTDSDPT